MMEEELTFDMGLEDILYQKFLLQICKICDDIYFTQKKLVEIPFEEKQRMAEEMVDFIGYALTNIKGSLVRIRKSKDFNKKIRKYGGTLSEKANRDRFARFVLLNHLLEKKIRANKIPSYLALASLALLSKEKLLGDVEDVKKISLFNIRIAALISPFIELHQKLQKEVKKGNIRVEKVLERGKVDKETLRYIG